MSCVSRPVRVQTAAQAIARHDELSLAYGSFDGALFGNGPDHSMFSLHGL